METTEKRVLHTPGPWKTRVGPITSSMEQMSYGHEVVIGGKPWMVAITHQRPFDHIHKSDPHHDGIVTHTGIGRREPDLTPHPNARLIAAAPSMLAALQLQHQNFTRQNLNPDINHLGDDDHEAWKAITDAISLATT